MQMQHRYVLHDHIIGALQERRIQCHNRHHALLGQSAGHGDCVFLRNTYIKGTLWIRLFKFQQTGSAGHCCGNGADPVIFLRKRKHCLSEAVGEGSTALAEGFAGGWIKFADTVELGGILLGKGVSLSFFGQNMDENRLLHLFGKTQQPNEIRQIIAVNRP